MSYVPYKVSDEKWYWRPEVAFRDADNNGTKDETNAATGVFYTLPVFIGSDNPVMVRKRKKFSKYRSGNRYPTQLTQDGYEDIQLNFTGPVIHRSWLYQLMDACTTTDNSPSSGYYTHVYANTATHVNPPKSIELLHVYPNDKSGGGESIIELITGCIVTEYKENGATGSTICTGAWVVHGSNIVAGTALTSPGYPEYPSIDFANFGQAVLTWTKGGAAVNGHLRGYALEITTDKSLIKEGGSFYPMAAKSPNTVDVKLKIRWLATETDSYDDSQDDPLTALNKDITLKNSRNVTTDYFQVAFADGFQELESDPVWEEGNLYENHMFSLNPHEAAGTVTLTEVNNLDDDRYET